MVVKFVSENVSPVLIDEVHYIKNIQPAYAFQDYLSRLISHKFNELNDDEFKFLLSQVRHHRSHHYEDPLPHHIIQKHKNYPRIFQLLQLPIYKKRLFKLDYTNSKGETIFACLIRTLVENRQLEKQKETLLESFPEIEDSEIEVDNEVYVF